MTLALAVPEGFIPTRSIWLSLAPPARLDLSQFPTPCDRNYRVGSSSKRGVVFFSGVPSDTQTLSFTPIHHRMHGEVS